MPKEFIMRGSTASGTEEVLNFGGQARPGYGYRMTELQIYPSSSIGSQGAELSLTITAANSAEDPSNPNFNNSGLIAVSMLGVRTDVQNGSFVDHTIVNDLFVITQDLILSAVDTLSGSPQSTNWQIRLEEIKLSSGAEAVANFKQYTIYNTG